MPLTTAGSPRPENATSIFATTRFVLGSIRARSPALPRDPDRIRSTRPSMRRMRPGSRATIPFVFGSTADDAAGRAGDPHGAERADDPVGAAAGDDPFHDAVGPRGRCARGLLSAEPVAQAEPKQNVASYGLRADGDSLRLVACRSWRKRG